jgi:drug/metabolite transporter (DMT)-like permease
MTLSLRQKAILALGAVAFSYALLSVVVRLMNAGFGPFTQVYIRIGLGCLLTAVFFSKKIRFTAFTKITHRDWFFLLLMGTVGYGLSVDFVTLGTLQTKLLDVAVISSTTPFFIFLFSVLILRKPFRSYLFLLVLIAFYGVCLLATRSFIPMLSQFGLGDFYILLFAIGLGFYILGRKMLSNHLNNYEIAVTVMFIAFICSFVTALFARETLSFQAFYNPVALLGLLLGGVLNLVATTLETFGFKHIDAVSGSQLMLLENVFAPLFGFFFYHETILRIEFFGALLVVAGVWFYIKYSGD